MSCFLCVLLSMLELTLHYRSVASQNTTNSAAFSHKPQDSSYAKGSSLRELLLTGYDPFMRPVFNQSDPVDLHLYIYIENLLDVDGKSQTISFLAEISYSWVDPLLVWDPAAFGGINHLVVPRDLLWAPELTVNRVEDLADQDAYETPLTVYCRGLVTGLTRTKITVSCPMNMISYPFDAHNCSSILIALDYLEEEIHYVSADAVFVPNFVPNSEFNITKLRAAVESMSLPNGVTQMVVVYLNLERNPTFVIVTFMVPISILSLISVLPFILPSDSEKKADIQLSVMLTFSVFMLLMADKIPPSPDIPITGLLMVFMMALNSMGLVCGLTLIRQVTLSKQPPSDGLMKLMIILGRMMRVTFPPEYQQKKVMPFTTSTNNVQHTISEGESGKPERKDGMSVKLAGICNAVDQRDASELVQRCWLFVGTVIDRMLLLIVAFCVLAVNVMLYRPTFEKS